MSIYYSKGIIHIPNVTGDVVITASAVENMKLYTDQIENAINMSGTKIGRAWMYTNKRYSSSSGDPVDNTGTNITGLISAKVGDTIRLRFPKTLERVYNSIKCFKADRTEVAQGNISFNTIVTQSSKATVIISGQHYGILDFILTSNSMTTGMAYFAFCTDATDIEKIHIAINEEIT